MSDDNVTFLRPPGAAPPGLPPLPGAPPPPAAPPAAPTPDEGDGAALVPGRPRRSAADSLAALPVDPPPLAPAPGHVPATFRSDGGNGEDEGGRPGLGTLSLSAILAVALAALRGTAGAVQDWRQRRLERQAEAEPLRKARLKLAEARLGTDAAVADSGKGRGGKVPSSQDFGRKSHKGGGGPGKGGSGSGGSGASPKSTGSRSGAGPKGSTGKGSSSGSPSSRPDTGRSGSGKGGKDKPSKGGKDAGRGSGTPGKLGKGGKGGNNSGPGKHDRTAAKGGINPWKSAGKGDKGKLGKSEGGKNKPGKSGTGSTGAPGRLGRALKDAKDGAKPWKSDKDNKGKGDSGWKNGDGAFGTKSGKNKPGKGGSGDGRVTLGQSIRDETNQRAGDRFKARRENPDPPFISRHRKARDDRSDGAEGAAKGAEGETPNDAPTGGDRASEGFAGGFVDDSGTGARSGYGDGTAWTPPPRRERRSADESMRDATEEAPTYTAERANRPGDNERPRWQPPEPAAIARGVRGLPRAPHRPAGSRLGTTRTTTRGAPVSAPAIRLPGTGGVAAEHLTEVTLDDVLDHLAASNAHCFETYDECSGLAQKATELRFQFLDLAEELRSRHNIIGRLTGAAMDRLAESMDLIARKADEMRDESLTAAETVETAHDAMHDAYKPMQQAAADAGLPMPSARIHNED